MSGDLPSFVGVYKNAFSECFCKRAIDQFEYLNELGYCKNRKQWEGGDTKKTRKDDVAMMASEAFNPNDAENDVLRFSSVGPEFNTIFWETYRRYAEEFESLKDLDPHYLYDSKIQKTNPGQGYHVWHCEQGGPHTAKRILAFILYLNDVEEGGETEFLYQRKRVKPETGTLVIFPAAFTHLHRGNPPISGVKYIITGWVEF